MKWRGTNLIWFEQGPPSVCQHLHDPTIPIPAILHIKRFDAMPRAATMNSPNNRLHVLVLNIIAIRQHGL